MATSKKTSAKRKTTKKSKSTTKRKTNRVSKEMLDLRGQIEAINRSQAVIEFELDGTIISANQNFLSVMGYSLEQVQGRHHQMFVDNEYAASAEYREFWAGLRDGNFRTDEFKRIGNGGREVWIRASYNPIFDADGKPFKVVKYATDVTNSKMQASDREAQIDAIRKSQAVIGFELDGTIVSANDNFLLAMGYELTELLGQHHRIFVDNETATSAEYKEFWMRLNRGEFVTGEFKRYSRNGDEVWIQASYNPIFDLNGKPCKVVKFATDITASKKLEKQVRDSEMRMKQQTEEQQLKTNELLAVANAVAMGDLNVAFPDLGNDALGQVAAAFDQALQAIRSTLVQVRSVADEVATSSQALASVSEEIASGAQQQASSLEETAASLEEITSAVKQNTDNSVQAQQLSSSSREVADSGGAVVGEAVNAMTAINKSTGKATDIITTIDEIAFQTNLLALNAAVEAARAGEQGRGFAVVASEVRNLAQRSAGAAKEIKQLLQDSFSAVETGTELVNRSGGTFEEIVTSVKRVADIVAEISSASTEQLSGIEQVNNAVSQMDRVTQANASQTQQMSNTSNSLQSQSEYLLQLVAEFELGNESGNFQASSRGAAKMVTPREENVQLPNRGRSNSPSTALPVELDSIGMGGEGSFVEF